MTEERSKRRLLLLVFFTVFIFFGYFLLSVLESWENSSMARRLISYCKSQGRKKNNEFGILHTEGSRHPSAFKETRKDTIQSSFCPIQFLRDFF